MNVHFRTLGCRLNEAETESWAEKFQANGHTIADNLETADIVVVNSCAVTSEAARKSRRLIKRLHRENPKAKMIVSGCHATLNYEETAKTAGVDLVVPNSDKNELFETVNREINLETMPLFASEPGEIALFRRGRHRAFVKVQDGCRYRCTYCIVTIARGQEKSRAIGDIVDEINSLEQKNIKEVILTGVHLGGYGDNRGIRLEDLIKRVLAETSVPRIRLGSLEPWDLTENFFDFFSNPRMMPHLHLPLQSGSDTVLKRMARRCTTAEFRKMFNRIKTITPNFNLTSDIIVGFPGETNFEWSETMEFVQDIDFAGLHIFSYSSREGTAAAGMPDQVSGLVKKRRSKQLHRLAEKLKTANFKDNLEKSVPVLWEKSQDSQPGIPKQISGYTPNYLRVAVTMDEPKQIENTIRPARLESVDPTGNYIQASLA